MTEVKCGLCNVVVYPDACVIANHDIYCLPDGRREWYSRDFGVVVHLCDESFSIEAQIARLRTEVDP